jgi:hypothetical protein
VKSKRSERRGDRIDEGLECNNQSWDYEKQHARRKREPGETGE